MTFVWGGRNENGEVLLVGLHTDRGICCVVHMFFTTSICTVLRGGARSIRERGKGINKQINKITEKLCGSRTEAEILGG